MTSSQTPGVDQLDFRKLTEQDLPAMASIEANGYRFPWTEKLLGSCLGSGYEAWGGWIQGELVGYVLSSKVLDEVHLLNLCVDASRQNLGVGRRLLHHLIARAQQQHAAWILLEVRASNASALRLYETEGFVEVGERPAYYQGLDQREDARVMKLVLESAAYSSD